MRHRHLGVTVGIAFALLILILVGVGWFGLSRMAQINREMKRIVRMRWPKVQLASDALRISNLNNRITMEIFLCTDRRQIAELLARRAQNSDRITALMKQLDDRAESQTETQLLAHVKQTRTRYIESYKNTTRILVDQEKPAEARQAMVMITLPLLLEYHAAWGDFVTFQGKEMDTAAKQSAAEYVATRKLVWLLTCLSIVIAVTIAVFTTRHIVAESSRRERAENETLRLNQQLEQKVIDRTAALAKSNEDLLQARDALRFEAAHDPLTAVWNHGAIIDFLRKEVDRQRRTHQSLGVILADVDHFKKINDSYGHLVGDTVLQQIAQRFERAIRSYDFVGRYGGEEFLILMPGCNLPDVIASAERLRGCIAEQPVVSSAGNVGVTVSMGVVSTAEDGRTGQDCQELLRAADAALYIAKAQGRNRLAISPRADNPARQRGNSLVAALAKDNLGQSDSTLVV
jgi:diguanylate cyclase (GGDEF)-like protein